MLRFFFLVSIAGLVACSGSGSVVTQPDEGETPSGPVVHSDYETFDASQYADQPVAVAEETTHDVPASLMENRADAGVEQFVAGFRVQVLATLDPGEAELMEQEVRQWWSRQSLQLPADSALPADMEVYRLFRQPYYRVRVGDLTRRVDAEELLALVSSRFDGAFIVPDQVTVRKSQ